MKVSYTGDIISRVKRLADAINGNLSYQDNFRSALITIADTGTANTTISIRHALGKIPVGYIANIDKSGSVYDDTRSGWTSSTMTLKCSASNAVLNLVVF